MINFLKKITLERFERMDQIKKHWEDTNNFKFSGMPPVHCVELVEVTSKSWSRAAGPTSFKTTKLQLTLPGPCHHNYHPTIRAHIFVFLLRGIVNHSDGEGRSKSMSIQFFQASNKSENFELIWIWSQKWTESFGFVLSFFFFLNQSNYFS